MKSDKPLILISNDDGVFAKGLSALIEVVKPFGDIVVVAPDKSNSAKSHAVTLEQPLFYKKMNEYDNVKIYSCSGTPVDCIKIGIRMLLDREPTLIVSGINHGSNAAINIVYSGTMAAAIEGCINGIPAVGFSVTDHAEDIDFEPAKHFVQIIIEKILKNGLKKGVCLNVNIPNIPKNELKGIKICRQTKGRWVEEFDKRIHPHGKTYYWLTGRYSNSEPQAKDTDTWALENNYVAVVPVKIDLTDYDEINTLNRWDLNS